MPHREDLFTNFPFLLHFYDLKKEKTHNKIKELRRSRKNYDYITTKQRFYKTKLKKAVA
jgi:hypothetical protein